MRPYDGAARDVADWFNNTDMAKITHEDLIGALVNAFNRIDALERRLAKVSNVASCLANGVKPD